MPSINNCADVQKILLLCGRWLGIRERAAALAAGMAVPCLLLRRNATATHKSAALKSHVAGAPCPTAALKSHVQHVHQ